MSEFKYACPVCGQHIRCDSTQSGSTMECPTCFQKIIVPQAPASEDQKFIIQGTKVGAERPLPAVVTNAPVPAPPVPGPNTVWPAVVFGILFFAAVLTLFVFRGRIFKPEPKPSPGPGGLPASRQPAGPTNTAVALAPADGAFWKLDLEGVTIPDVEATGSVHGRLLTPQRVILEVGTLTLRTSNSGSPDLGVSIYLHANQSEDLAGQTVNIRTNAFNVPWVNLRWKDEQGKAVTQTIKNGYALRLEFGQLAGDKLPGKIYLCSPDEQQSYVVGNFTARIRKPKPKT